MGQDRDRQGAGKDTPGTVPDECGGASTLTAPRLPGPSLPAGRACSGQGAVAVPAWRGWHGPHGFLESPVSHPRPPAQPFSCLPSLLAASQPPYSAPGPLGVAAAEPSRYRAPSLTRGGTGRSWLPLLGRSPPLALPAPRQHRIPPEGCCGRAGPYAPPPSQPRPTGSGRGPPARSRCSSALASPREPPPAAG